jgi:glycosyltransferase involved in cell wall biosynthesis
MGIFGRFSSRDSKAAKRRAEEIEILHKSSLVDPVWYRRTYPDLGETPIDAARHYLEHGADEGRNPGPLFDTNFYLEENPDVAESGMNPLVHYILHGAAEGRKPNPHFHTSSSLKQNSDIKESDRHPLEHHVKPDATEGRPAYPKLSSQQRIEQNSEVSDVRKDDIAEHFDAEFYIGTYSDVANAKVDPLEHYFFRGWKEGRDPAPWFSTTYYLRANHDVAAANVNPFWHYVMAGRDEGRSPKQVSSAREALLAYLMPPEETETVTAVPDHDRIPEANLLETFRTTIQNAAGVVLSFSHNCYPMSTGGTEMFISDEQKLFNAQRFAYMHLSPLVSSLFVRESSPDESLTQIVINGEVIGVAMVSEVVRILVHVSGTMPADRILLMHSPIGQTILGFLRIFEALEPTKTYYWIHDFSSICTGYNLLRNHVEFCYAPPQDSMACSVCIYGSSRRRNARHLLKMFEVANFTVVAPSEVARKIWLEASDLPHRNVVVQEHCRVDYSAGLQRDHRLAEQIGLSGQPIKVAFVGYPVMHKGWPVFERLVDETRSDSAYEFFHFAKRGVGVRSRKIRAIDAVVTSDRRDAMVELLRVHEIDIVVIPAPWPETFSYVTFEALAAGCDILTLKDSGNVAATVLRTGRGRVFGSEDELVEFFTCRRAMKLVRSRAIHPNPCGSLLYCGTTAALVFGSTD